jgi:hypothetical protein
MVIRRLFSNRAAGLFAAAALAVAAAFSFHTVSPHIVRVHAQSSVCPTNIMPASLASTLPTQFIAGLGQQAADCMAWQEFIALNWRADPKHPGVPDPTASPDSFGTVDDPAPKVWETYLDSGTIFATAAQYKALTAQPNLKRLSAISKFADGDLNLSSTLQAGSFKWLTSQSGNLTYYEVRVNNDEVAYIQTNSLTTFAGQATCAAQPGQGGYGGFNLPSGIGTPSLKNVDYNCAGVAQQGGYGTNSGAIEVKAAWTALPKDHSLDYRYKTSVAQISDPYGNTSTVTVGLVGLHIIHKVPGGQQFIWATFEQVDDSPDENNGGYSAPTLPTNPNLIPMPGGTYTYFNLNCQNDQYYNCLHNQLPGNACPVPPKAGCDPYSAPMQITRINPVGTGENNVTGYAWSMLPKKSVYNYYRLINVMWPNANTQISPGAKVPLTLGSIQPTVPVANTTLETFEQQDNCLTCHKSATIAQASSQSKTLLAGRMHREVKLSATPSSYASDYSFVFAINTTH